jgi:hyperosmotically inducible protein
MKQQPERGIQMNNRIGRMLVTALIFWIPAAADSMAQKKQDLKAVHARLAQEVRHQLIMLSSYSVFDNLEFEIQEVDTVVLSGQVTRPIVKSDAESAVLSIEGAGKVVNKIEVLPLSPADDRIRRAAYRSIFTKSGLERYGMQSVPPIHIIVKDGNITLVGIVATEMDKNLAGIAANEVPGVFKVINKLAIERK